MGDIAILLDESITGADMPAKPARLPAQGSRGRVSDLRGLIQSARETVAQAVDSALTTLYWQIGQRVQRDILKEKRADYGAEIVSALGRQLAAEFGRGFDEKPLRHMIRFAEAFPDEKIVSALRRELSWIHFKRLIYLDLLFYHRHLRRLVVIELKLVEFKPGDKGQMELYLRWLDRHERKESEEAPIGLILCAGQRRETTNYWS